MLAAGYSDQSIISLLDLVSLPMSSIAFKLAKIRLSCLPVSHEDAVQGVEHGSFVGADSSSNAALPFPPPSPDPYSVPAYESVRPF